MGGTKKEEVDHTNNSKYKQYAAAVEKALKAFEYTAEWADLISALGKLGKSLQTSSKWHQIPKAVTVSKRLSQCLHPALPPGVHLKTLEVYKQIFTITGPEELALTLHLYTLGIFPLLSHAGIRVRNEVMGILEQFFLPLGPSLAPSLVGFFNGLLPGLEDGSEFFERTNSMLEKIAESVGERTFFSSLWYCVLSTPQVQFPALIFILSNYDKKKSLDDQLHITGYSVDLMVSALCATATGDQILAQRQLLDFLIIAFPLNSQQLVRSDLIRLVKSTIFVVLKRDMSLNRRLYTWLQGGSPNKKDSVHDAKPFSNDYFLKHSLPLLKEAVFLALSEDDESASVGVKLCKVMSNLMDKSDIGGPLLGSTLLSLLIHFKNRAEFKSTSQVDVCRNKFSLDKSKPEIKAISSLVNSLEAGYLWRLLVNQLNESSRNSDSWLSIGEYADLALYSLASVQLDAHSDIRHEHIPQFLIDVMTVVKNIATGSSLQPKKVSPLLHLSIVLLDVLQESRGSRASSDRDVSASTAGTTGNPEGEVANDSGLTESNIEELIGTEGQGVVETCIALYLSALHPLLVACKDDSSSDLTIRACQLFRQLADFPRFTLSQSDSETSYHDGDGDWLSGLSGLCLSRWTFPSPSGRPGPSDIEPIEALLHLTVLAKSLCRQQSTPQATDKGTPIYIKSIMTASQLNFLETSGFFKRLAKLLWKHMTPDRPEAQQEAARLFWMLHTSLGSDKNSVCEDIFVSELTSPNSEIRAGAGQRFKDMWILSRSNSDNHYLGVPSRPFHRALLIMLKAVSSPGADALKDISRTWITDCVHHDDSPRILLLCILLLLSTPTARVSIQCVHYAEDGGKTSSRSIQDLVRVQVPFGASLFHAIKSKQCLGDSERELSKARYQTINYPEPKPVVSPSKSALVRKYSFDESHSESGSETGNDENIRKTIENLLSHIIDQIELEETVQQDVHVETAMEALDLHHGNPQEKDMEIEPGDAELFHPLHAHFLLYTEGGEAELEKSGFVFSCLAGLLGMSDDVSETFVNALSSNKTTGVRDATSGWLAEWTERHQKSILGKGFLRTDDDDDEGEWSPSRKQYMYLELVLNVSLYYLRSYFLNSPVAPVKSANLTENWHCKVSCLEFLCLLLKKLGDQVEQQGHSFAKYICDVLNKSKFQKCILHSLMVTAQESAGEQQRFSSDIFNFNIQLTRQPHALLFAYQRSLLDLSHSLVRLEFLLKTNGGQVVGETIEKISAPTGSLPLVPLVELRLFLLTLLNAFKSRFSHHHLWLRFLIRSLPYLGRSLPSLTLHISEQLGKNLELTLEACYNDGSGSAKQGQEFPINYVSLTLEALAVIWHRCLVASGAGMGGSGTNTSNTDATVPWKPTELISNLFKVFSSSDTTPNLSLLSVRKGASVANWFASARAELLGALPHVLSTLCHLWTAVKSRNPTKFPVGTPQNIRRLILDLLNPIAMNHSTNFLSSLALVWLTRDSGNTEATNCGSYSGDQLDIADLLLSIKVLPFENLLVSLLQSLREPVRVKDISDKDAFPIEISLLQLLHACVRTLPASLLSTCWSSLNKIFSEVLTSSSAPSLFIAFRLLVDYIQACFTSEVDDKKMVKEVQDVFQKLSEALNSIVGLQLEQATWLKRTLVLKNADQAFVNGHGGKEENQMIRKTNSLDRLVGDKYKRGIGKDESNRKRSRYSFQALALLSEYFSLTLDAISKSEDRDRLMGTVAAIWGNVHPYLKNRSDQNAASFSAASKFLSSLSPYSYTRSIWRRATLDMFLDPGFFRMESDNLKLWLITIDNLMTQDKTSFKDFLARLAVQPGPSLFTSREQDYDVRCASLRRLAVIIFSSQLDQYHSNLPEIQERLTETLRLYHVPRVHASVFLCFRALLFRLSPHHLTSLWPLFISEMVQVLMDIESYLHDDPDKHQDRREERLQLFLSACKLLEAMCTYPSVKLLQFQMYQWAFCPPVSTPPPKNSHHFIPYSRRILSLLTRQDDGDGGELSSVLEIKSLGHIQRLTGFFRHLSKGTGISAETSSEESSEICNQSFYVDFLDAF